MIQVKPPPQCPASLSTPDPAVAKERARALEVYGHPPRPDPKFEFKVYKRDDVVAALEAAFHRKCAYCESPYAATQKVAVEHYRPKGKVTNEDGPPSKGYYWLASEWHNLLPSCTDCNSARTQQTSGGATAVLGKANAFPLANAAQRATRPGEETRERPLLPHPYFDDPRELLEFVEEGVVRPRRDRKKRPSAKGKAVIQVCGLERIGLVQARAALLKKVRADIKRIDDTIAAWEEAPTAALKRVIAGELDDLESRADPAEPYSAMAADAVTSFVRAKRKKLGI